MSEQPIFRFAPSPNGELHLGHAYSALLNLKMARAMSGKMLLRIEDIDTVRCTPELENQMLRDLEWIGFEWDEEPRRQSEHFDEYRAALERLKEQDLAYPSTLSRSQITKLVAEKSATGKSWPTDPDGAPVYPGEERLLSAAKKQEIYSGPSPIATRLDMKSALKQLDGTPAWQELHKGEIVCDAAAWGDVVLARKDTPTSYHLSCVLDDAVQNVTHIVRGMDLYNATSVHVVLQKLFGLMTPVYHHHDLITDSLGKKLSKSEKPRGLRSLREAGITRQGIEELLFADGLT